MKAKTKTFDCVQMKRQAQETLLAEYRARRNEFDSITVFLEAKAKESAWVSALWERFSAHAK